MTQSLYDLACSVVGRYLPRGLRRAYDAHDFVADAVVELAEKHAEATMALVILVARRRIIDAMRSPRARVRPLEVDIEARRPLFCEMELRDQVDGRTRDPEHRAILWMICQGYTTVEVAKRSRFRIRTIQRILKGMR